MLTGRQKRFLRKKAHHEKPIFQVGKDGVNDNMLKQINEALELRELIRSEEHTSELQSRGHLVCRLLLEKKICEVVDNYEDKAVNDADRHTPCRVTTDDVDRGDAKGESDDETDNVREEEPVTAVHVRKRR